jgi:hypothetical protein
LFLVFVIPAKFVELRLDPPIILCIGVDQGDEKDMLSPHIEKVSPHLLHCIPVLQDVSFFQNHRDAYLEQQKTEKIETERRG